MADRQAVGIDIDDNALTGGINVDRLNQHFQQGSCDFLIIKAGLGIGRSPVLAEQREIAGRLGIPFTTYHLITPQQDMLKQAQRYVDWVGAQEPSYIIDVEKPAQNVQPRTKGQLNRYIDELFRLTQKQPVIYSRADLLGEIGFLIDAKQFRLWIAQYVQDIAQPPPPPGKEPLRYRYFHDFSRDYAGLLPPSVYKAELAENVVLWQFTDKGNGPYYIYNERTSNPEFPVGKKQADLNISVQRREDFYPSLFGIAAPGGGEAGEAAGAISAAEPTYPGITNQDLIDLIYIAARPFSGDPWVDWIGRANLENLAFPAVNRDQPYTGEEIEAIPAWTDPQKQALLALIRAPQGDEPEPTYPGLTNGDMFHLIFTAARPFSNNPWREWVMPARLASIAVPSGNRRKPYTGPKIENLPGLAQAHRSALETELKKFLG